MYPSVPQRPAGSGYKDALFAGGCFALAALAASFLVLTVIIKVKDSLQGLIVTATVAAFIVGALLWKLIFSGGRRPNILTGAGVGALVGIVSHPLAWYLLMVWLFVAGGRSSLGDRTVDPLSAIPASLFFSLASLLAVGWATAPVGALVGGVLGYVAGMGVSGPAAQGVAGRAPDYSGIDHVLYDWAQRRGLQISTEHEGQAVRSFFVAGRSGQQYQVWVDSPDERYEVHIRAWDYGRLIAEAVSSPYDLGGRLEGIYATVMSWDASKLLHNRPEP
jgi:hypothetical protein